MIGNIIFDLLLLGVANLFTPKKRPHVRNTSIEPLAFDAMNEQAKETLNYREPTGDIHRDIVDDGGPDW